MKMTAMQKSGLRLVKRPVQRVQAMGALRDGTTGCVVVTAAEVAVMRPVLLPRVWAVGEVVAALAPAPTHDDETVVNGTPSGVDRVGQAVDDPTHDDKAIVNGPPSGVGREVPVELAFYRRYTEGMLRRYVRLSMAAGRVPSLLGRELFRGHVTSYRMHNFEDVVIFCHDMERVLGQMQPLHQELLKRVGMQQYSQGEAAGALGMSLRSVLQHYNEALDWLTRRLLKGGLLDPQKACQ